MYQTPKTITPILIRHTVCIHGYHGNQRNAPFTARVKKCFPCHKPSCTDVDKCGKFTLESDQVSFGCDV